MAMLPWKTYFKLHCMRGDPFLAFVSPSLFIVGETKASIVAIGSLRLALIILTVMLCKIVNFFLIINTCSNYNII